MNHLSDVSLSGVVANDGVADAEARRLVCLQGYEVLDSPAETAFDDLAFLASVVCNVPMAMVSFVDADRQWAKAATGPVVTQLPRDMSFCAQVIEQSLPLLEVQDAAVDPRFADNAQVGGTDGIRFYAGAALVAPTGHALGTLCVLDRQPRTLSDRQRQALLALSRQVVDQLERRRLALLVEMHGIAEGAVPVGSVQGLSRRLAEEWQRHARRGETLGLLLVDLPQTGVRAGVPLLETVAACLRSSDHLARLDAQTLAAVLPSSGMNASMLVAQRMRQALDRAMEGLATSPARLAVATMIPNRSGQPAQLLDRARHALSRSGLPGRSRVEAFSGW